MTKKKTKHEIETIEELQDKCNKLRKEAWDEMLNFLKTKNSFFEKNIFTRDEAIAAQLISTQKEINQITKEFLDRVSLLKNRDRVNYEIFNNSKGE